MYPKTFERFTDSSAWLKAKAERKRARLADEERRFASEDAEARALTAPPAAVAEAPPVLELEEAMAAAGEPEELSDAEFAEEQRREALFDAFGDPAENEETFQLWPRSQALLAEMLTKVGPKLGRGAYSRLESEAESVLLRAQRRYAPSQGAFAPYARAALKKTWQAFINHHTFRNLLAERKDQDMRDSAGTDLTAYLVHAEKRLRVHQRHFAKLWKVRGLTGDDVVAEVLAELAAGKRPEKEDERVGREATIVFASRVRGRLYRAALAEKAALEDWGTLQASHAASSARTPEELLIEKEDGEREPPEEKIRLEALALQSDRAKLSRIQRTWLDAFLKDFATHGELNLARVGTSLPKPRSRYAASRAWAAIRTLLQAEMQAANEDAEK